MTSGTGTCYPDALNQFLCGNTVSGGTLVHGRVDGIGGRIGHAWVENEEWVWDSKFDVVPRDQYYARFNPQIDGRFTKAEALLLPIREGHYGPWAEPKAEPAPGGRRTRRAAWWSAMACGPRGSPRPRSRSQCR